MSRSWHLWEVPGKRVAVRLSFEAMAGLRTAAMKGFPSRGGRGEETGGLLLGHTSRQGGRTVVEIEDFEPVRCEHAFGPSLLFSPQDRQAFEEQLSWRRSVKDIPKVVGFWRSHTRRNLEVAAEDVDLFTRHFSRPSDVFLLIKANETGPSGAGFIIWEGGRIRSNSPYLEFPFDPEALASGAAPERPARAPAGPAEPAPDPVADTPQAPVKRARLRRRTLLWASAGLAAIMVLAATAGLWRAAIRPAEHEGGLALRVSPQGSGLRLDWDRNASAIRTARKGTLWIHDGTADRRIDLDVRQLTGGSIAYWPKSADVAFRLQISSTAGITSESLRAVGAPSLAAGHARPPGAAASATLPPVPDDQGTQAPLPDAVLERMYQARQTQALAPAAAAAQRAPEPAAQQPAAPRPFARLRTLSPPRVEALPAAPPPQIPSEKPPAPKLSNILQLNSAPIPEPPVDSDPSLKISAKYVDDEPHGHFGGRRKIPDFSPPALLRAAPPQIPSALRSRIRHEVAIDVKVYVNGAGGVDYSELYSDHVNRNRDLETLAVFAARKWKFTPARIAGQNAPSEVILHFQFAPAPAVTERAASEPAP